MALTVVGCGQFGLPTSAQEGQIERGDPTLVDVDPKVGSVGSIDLAVRVIGLDTFFDDSTVVELPDLPEISITSIEIQRSEEMTLLLDIPEEAPLITSPVVVTSARDGTLTYEAGFTVVH